MHVIFLLLLSVVRSTHSPDTLSLDLHKGKFLLFISKYLCEYEYELFYLH